RAIFKSWFVDFDPVRAKAEGRDTGLPKEIADLFPDRLVESEIGEVPEGWTHTTLGELHPDDPQCVITGPFGSHLHAHDYADSGVPLILVKHVGYGALVGSDHPLVNPAKAQELTRYQLEPGDIVFTRVGAVGRSALIGPRESGWLISGQLLRVRCPRPEVLHPRYLAQAYVDPAFVSMVESHALGSTRPSLNTKLLLNFKILLPAPSAMRAFVDAVTPIDARATLAAAESRALDELRDTLLPKLISGELRVPEAMLQIEGATA
ncbi:MAG: hypothetical protein KDB73_19460, partial [Planctomycetes bacterium]|nr:hypothetical protein [Planctomycetota bacterium]